jgi:hypothetical protein
MSRRDELATELGRVLFDALPEDVALLYADRRDELPSDLYREALGAGRAAREMVLQDFIDEFLDSSKWDAAVETVIEAARSEGVNVRSPLVSVDPADWYVLVDEVMDRDTSDGWNVMMDIAARDQVVLGYHLSDAYVEDGDVHDLGITFGLLSEEDAEQSEWLKKVAAKGQGHPTILFAVPGDELLGFLRDVYVHGEEPGAYVTVRAYDAGLFDAMYGSGWFEHVDQHYGLEFELQIDEFLDRVWVDNEPGKSGTWTEIAGAPARLRAIGDLLLRVPGKW